MPLIIQSGTAETKNLTQANSPKVIRKTFKYPFRRAPIVQLGIIAMDDNLNKPVRISTEVTEVHTHFVDITLQTWNVSHLAWIKTSWMAIGRANSDDDILPGEYEVEESPIKVEIL